jgi:hypothetical protein
MTPSPSRNFLGDFSKRWLVSFGEHRYSHRKTWGGRFLILRFSSCFRRIRATQKNRDMVYDGGLWNLLAGKFLLCNSEFLILHFSRDEVRLHVHDLKRFPNHFKAYIAGHKELRHANFTCPTVQSPRKSDAFQFASVRRRTLSRRFPGSWKHERHPTATETFPPIERDHAWMQ